MFTLAQLYCKNILPPVLCNYKIFLDCVSLQSLSPLPRVSWHRAAAALGSQELCAGRSKMAAKRPPEMSPAARRPRGPASVSRDARKAWFTHKGERVPQLFFFFFKYCFKKLECMLECHKLESGDTGLF